MNSLGIDGRASGSGDTLRRIFKQFQGPVTLEPSLAYRFLPGCRECGLKHPRTAVPPVDSDVCRGCGRTLATTTFDAPAILIGGVSINFGNLLLRLGRMLATFAKRL